MEVQQKPHQDEAARETGNEELLERGSPVEVQQMPHQDEAAKETGDEELPERGSPVEVKQELHQEEAARKAGDEELPERGSPVEVQQTPHQDEAAKETGDEELPERGSPVEVQQELHQEEAARKAGDEELPERGSPVEVQQTDAKRPIIVVMVEDKGDEDDPHRATRNQAGCPAPGHQRWESGKWHLELGENEEMRPGRSSPSFEAATGRRTLSSLYLNSRDREKEEDMM